MQHELKQFLRKIFKEDAESILRQHLNSLGLSNVDAATNQQRKKLAEGLRTAFPYASVAKTSILYSELLNILKLEVSDISKTKSVYQKNQIYYDEDGNEISSEEAFFGKDDKRIFTSKEEYIEFKMDNQKKIVNKFWNKIDKSLTKFEVIFNLFWLKAGEAEIRGVKHEDVLKITNKSLVGIKKDLEESFSSVKEQFGIKNLKKKELPQIKFHLKNLPEIKDKSYEKNKNKMYFGEDEILEEIKNFWIKIENLYNDFSKIFKNSLEKEINLKKNNLNDRELIKITEQKMIHVWNEIEKEYEDLKNKIEDIQKKAKYKIKND